MDTWVTVMTPLAALVNLIVQVKVTYNGHTSVT